MEDKLYQKLENELKDFKTKMKENGVDYAIDRAYELTTKQEIIDSIEFDHDLSKTQIKAFTNTKDYNKISDKNISEIVRKSIEYIVAHPLLMDKIIGD